MIAFQSWKCSTASCFLLVCVGACLLHYQNLPVVDISVSWSSPFFVHNINSNEYLKLFKLKTYSFKSQMHPASNSNVNINLYMQTKNDVIPVHPSHTSPPKFQLLPGGPLWTNSIQILVWTMDNVSWWHIQDGVFRACHSTNNQSCVATTDRSRYNTSQVIFLHQLSIPLRDFPTYKFCTQKWIFFELEAPPEAWKYRKQESILKLKYMFNFTSTFTPDSDIPVFERIRHCTLDDSIYQRLKQQSTNYSADKTGHVVWFVSHCHTQSRRELYVQELRKYIPVDIYGECGKKKCGARFNYGNCDKSLVSVKYRFYLSFENSLCDGYVTEKLWRYMDSDINVIPVVLGSANYSHFLPAGTYVNVRDFRSPGDLAHFLSAISHNESLYNSYIQRKMATTCTHGPGKSSHFSPIPHYACRLCNFLHKTSGTIKGTPDITEFWSFKWRCLLPKKFYRNVYNSLAKAKLPAWYNMTYIKS